jgi:hypothetical protein
MFATDKVEQQPQSIIIFHKIFKDLPLFHTVKIVKPDDHLAAGGSSLGNMEVFEVLFLIFHGLGTASEGLHKFNRVFRLLELLE